MAESTNTHSADVKATSPEFGLVVFGATSFVGKLLVAYLADYLASGDETLHWAIAGRSRAKLDGVKQSLGDAGDGLPVVVADASDPAQMQQLCSQTRVVVSTVGPYALYGEPLVQACAQSGTDYCDLTGEVQWIARMIGRYQDAAKASGARLVHCCGFDSIPSDLGVHFLQQQAQQELGEPVVDVKMRVRTLKGGISGGTAASLLNVMREAAKNPETRAVLRDPFALCPPDHDFMAPQHRVNGAEFDPEFDCWTAPFVMAMINEAVVRRSNALSADNHSSEFSYNEASLVASRMKALGFAIGLGGMIAGVSVAPTRALIERFVLPSPGEGPSPQAQQSGRYDLRFYGETAAGKSLRTKVTGEGDPGYASTSRMLGQAGLCLALDHADKGGGFWTPASLLGDELMERLQQHARLTFERI